MAPRDGGSVKLTDRVPAPILEAGGAGVAASAGLDAEAIEWAAVKQHDPTLIWSQMMPGQSALRRPEGYDAVYAQLGFGTKRGGV
jgi:hypothetical protein